MKIKYITVLFLLLLSSALTITSFADDTLTITDFDSESITNIDWIIGDAVDETVVVPDAYKNSDRQNILSVHGQYTDSSVVRTVTAKFDTPVDLSLYKSISVSIFVDPISGNDNNSCFARLTLHNSAGDQFEGITSLEAGSWKEISVDISEWNGRKNVTSIEFGVVPDHIDSGIWSGGYTLDNICATDPVNTAMTDRFSFESCSSEGGSVTFSSDKSYFVFSLDESTDIAFIEFDIAVPVELYANALRINLENLSDTDEFAAIVLRSDLKAPTRIAKSISDTESTVHLLDIEDPASITGIRLEFPNKGGSLIIKAIEFTSTYDSTSYITCGDVSRCELSADSKILNIIGTLPREHVTSYSDCELLLYSLELNEDPHSFDYENAKPIARHGISTKFRFTVDTEKNTLSPKFKKYVVMISSSPMIYVDTPTYVAEVSSDTKANTPLKLGLYAESTYITESFADATITEVYIDSIINRERSGYMYSSKDGNYYFNKSYVDELDRKLGALKTAGISVTLRLITDPSSYPEGIYDYSAGSSETSLFGMGYSDLQAAVEFLSARYSGENGPVDGLIVGNAVNSGDTMSYSNSMSMTEFVNLYGDLLRFIYLCTDNAGCPTPVYASVGNVFEYEMLGKNNNRFDTNMFINALCTYINDEGDFSWGVCVESNMSDSQDRNGDKILSVRDTDTFESLFALLFLKKGTKEIPVINAEHISLTNGTYKRAAKLVSESIMKAAQHDKLKGYILVCQNGASYSDDIKNSVKAFKRNDKNAIENLDINYNDYSKLIENSRLSVKKETNATVASSLPFTAKGEYVFFDFNSYSQLESISHSHNSQTLKLVPMQTGTLALRADLKRVTHAEPMGFGVSFGKDFTFANTPAISFDVMLSGLPDSYSDIVKLTLRFTGDENVCTADAQLTPNSWQSVYIDMSNIEDLSDNTYRSIEFSLTDIETDSTTVYLDNITGHSEKHNSEELTSLISSSSITQEHSGNNINPTIVTIFIIIITSLISLTIILILRSRRSDPPLH